MWTSLVSEFGIQTASGVVSVFLGVYLALVVERRRKQEDEDRHEAGISADFDRALDTLLGSVVKNTAEAKRMLRLLEAPGTHGRIHSGLEASVWTAAQDQFFTACRNIDERVIFAQFFDDVQRVHAFVEYRRNLHVSTTVSVREASDPALQALQADADCQLTKMVAGLRFLGTLLITDHGRPVHKRMIGIHTDVVPAA